MQNSSWCVCYQQRRRSSGWRQTAERVTKLPLARSRTQIRERKHCKLDVNSKRSVVIRWTSLDMAFQVSITVHHLSKSGSDRMNIPRIHFNWMSNLFWGTYAGGDATIPGLFVRVSYCSVVLSLQFFNYITEFFGYTLSILTE